MLRILSRMVALLVGVAALSPISAQSIRLLPKPPRPFEVERLERWAPEYLTVTRSFYIAKKRSGDASPVTVLNANGMPDQQALWFEVIPQPGDPETYRLVPGTVILTVDGVSTRGMTEEEFYRLLDGSENHVLGCRGTGLSFDLHFRTRQAPEWVRLLDLAHWPSTARCDDSQLAGMFQQLMTEKCSSRSLLEETEKQLEQSRSQGKGEILRFWDSDIDWEQFHTYDFVLMGNDPLMDKEIMEVFARQFFPYLVRDTDDPDLLVMIARDKDESLQATYVPPTTTVISDGRTTRRVYNWTRTDYHYETREHSHVERSGGYTQTTVLTDLYLELSLLDAKRLRDSAQRVPPIVYQLKFNRHVTDRQFGILDEYKAVASWACFPYSPATESYRVELANLLCEPVEGSKDLLRVTYVGKGLPADLVGYRVGDVLQEKKSEYRVVERDGRKVNLKLRKEPRTAALYLEWSSFGAH